MKRLVVALALAGCAHGSVRVAGTNLAPKQQLEACHALLDAKKLDEASRCTEALERGADPKIARYATYDHATALLYQSDFKRSVEVFEAMIAREHAGARFDNEAMGHNAVIWVRWAEHNLDAAIAENERVRQTIESAKVSDDDRRGVLLHYWWDRAYLMLDDAERKSTDARAAASAAADEARKSYEQLARQPADIETGYEYPMKVVILRELSAATTSR